MNFPIQFLKEHENSSFSVIGINFVCNTSVASIGAIGLSAISYAGLRAVGCGIIVATIATSGLYILGIVAGIISLLGAVVVAVELCQRWEISGLS